jgi:hypothetical protein
MAQQEQLREITAKLENGVKELFESDKYAEYLRTMSRFHKYSTRNTLLIYQQFPTARRIASYTSWKNNFNRQVKKGEHSIKIFAPIPFVKREEAEKIDPITRRPIIGDDGQPLREEIEVRSARFKVVSVFDISQTDGDALPELAANLTGNVERYELFMDALRAVSPLPIEFATLADADGRCIFGEKIEINTGMSEIQTVSAVIHEITHAKLHDLELLRDGETRKDRRTEEIEAESVSYSVAQFYGIETGGNSFGYLAEWASSRELKELTASLDVIRKTAAELMDGIDEKYQELAKERGIDLTAEVIPQIENTRLPEAQPERPASFPETRAVGASVLMTPVFDAMNFNRNGKKIRVTVEEPIGKYPMYSRDENGDKTLYFLTASGRIDRTAGYFQDEWSEETRKYVNYRPRSSEFDEVLRQVAGLFEKDMAEPTQWAKYQHAAVLNRLDECEAHNAPVRKLRADEDKARREAQTRHDAQERREKQAKYDSRLDEIADAVRSGKTISVGYKEYEYDGKNPVLDLFKLYGVDLPLRTQGWVNTGLAEITDGSYRYYKSKRKGDSTAFGGHLKKLRDKITETPIEQKRRQPGGKMEMKKLSIAQENFAKFTEMFPDFANQKYSYLRLESSGFEPLSLEWIFGDRISVMHTYTQAGDLMYDPMIEFVVNREAGTMTASTFEQSNPPLYQYHDVDGIGRSVDGNGNQREVADLSGKLNKFSKQWFDNLTEQAFIPVRATVWNDGRSEDVDVSVTFDKDGRPIIQKSGDYTEPAADKGTLDSQEKPSDDIGAYLPEKPEKKQPVAESDLKLPDPLWTVAELAEYGYTEPDMYPLSVGRAVELFDTDHTIYLLYPDNTEVMALDRDEIITFSGEGFCGITHADWENSPVFKAQQAVGANSENAREADLLYGDNPYHRENKFGIYQIKDSIGEARNFRFAPMSELEALGLSVDRANYELVYTAPFSERAEYLTDRYLVLNNLFNIFNTAQPADYAGRSLSVSDVVVLRCNGDITAHFVDRAGFVELPFFTGGESETQARLGGEKTFSQVGTSSDAPTVAELESDVKAGKSISVMDLARAVNDERQPPANKAKPSILAELEEAKKLAAKGGKQDNHKTNERGYE